MWILISPFCVCPLWIRGGMKGDLEKEDKTQWKIASLLQPPLSSTSF
ncbi:Uncharacterised protein [Vibrio cholerae]|nr:Uncharacterised protein [Vibrio cholerae]CSI56105.1 Uncharacterised protein [Vibrio cholerae]